MSRARLNLFIEPEHARRLDQLAARKGVSKSSIVAVALASWLSPQAGDTRDMAITKRLDRLSSIRFLRPVSPKVKMQRVSGEHVPQAMPPHVQNSPGYTVSATGFRKTFAALPPSISGPAMAVISRPATTLATVM